MTRQNRDRRGVLLLVVLTLLALFAAITVTFVVLTGQYRKIANSDSKLERQGDPPQKLLDDGLGFVLFGSEEPVYKPQVKWYPGIKTHGLLEDKIGQDGFSGVLSSSSSPLANGQLLTFTVLTEFFNDANTNGRFDPPEPWLDLNGNNTFELATDKFLDFNNDGSLSGGESIIGDTDMLNRYEGPWWATGGNYNGCELTMITGSARGMTSRIVGYGYNASTRTATITVARFGELDPSLAVSSGDKCRINGRSFNGTGPGFDIAYLPNDPSKTALGSKINFGLGNFPLALLPNMPSRLHHPESAGGADEDYDIADYQNMMLAFNPRVGGGLPVIPSMHRQHLVDFWFHDFVSATPKYVPNSNPLSGLAPADKWKALLFPYGLDGIRNGDATETSLSNNDKDLIASFRRSIIFRPLPEDHPNFSGGNMASRPTAAAQITSDGSSYFEKNGPWDVDNDGDGVPDSIWLDLGFPVQTAPDGRRFKPLFAALCIDLDGRLNVNAHSSPAEVEQHISTVPIQTQFLAGSSAPAGITAFGQGYGTPEIRLGGLYADPNDVKELLYGHSDTSTNPPHYTEGRYGELPLTGDRRLPGTSTGFDGYVSRQKQYGWPQQREMFDLSTGWPIFIIGTGELTIGWSAYGTPCDVRGTSWTGIDKFGQPITWGAPGKNASGTVITEPTNDHYELDLSHKVVRGSVFQGGRDNPFSVAELERILRYYDVDANTLPDRLRHLLDEDDMISANGDPKGLRQIVTTHQYDLPSPNFSTTRESALAGAKYSGDLTDLLVQRIRALNGSMTVVQAQDCIRNGGLLPADLLSGRRMDVNRPFGNGRDDNNDGVVDDPAEAMSETVDIGISSYLYTMDLNNDGVVNNNDKLARQNFAKHLYVLLMLLKGSGQIDFDNDPSNNSDAETAYGLAQYAINVVDFRDRDVTNTPFEFDLRPFQDDNGSPDSTWDVDGRYGEGSMDDNVTGYRGLVWGCERPEMLMTETLAYHDRRTEDTDQEQAPLVGGTEKGKTTDIDPVTMMPKDTDFDQRLQPRGALFVELFNPWSGNYAPRNAECYRDANQKPQSGTNNDFKEGIVLSKLSPDTGDGVRHGVWRLLIVKNDTSVNPPIIGRDPDDPVVANRPTAYVERSVYFVRAQFVPSDANDGQAHCVGANINLPFSPLLPGRYAVVGGYDRTEGSGSTKRYISLISRHNQVATYPTSVTDLKIPDSRRIELSPFPNEYPLISNQVNVLGNEAITPNPPAITDRQPAVAVIIDAVSDSGTPVTRRLSISEPIGGYTSSGFDPSAEMGEGAYTSILDTPFDNSRFSRDGTIFSYAEIHLQRLADPLRCWNPEPGASGHDASKPVNPYLTVDSKTVDLSIYNGVTSTPAKDPALAAPIGFNFATLQRGNTDGPSFNKFWRHEPVTNNSLNTAEAATSLMIFKHPLNHTLGFINKNYQPAYTMADAPNASYLGAPKEQAYPWLAWNNRPFVGPLELMLVPKSRQSQLLREFNVTTGSPDVYDPSPATAFRFPHLLNFFKSRKSGDNTDAPSLFRVFEYLQVPSRFVGTETFLKPGSWQTDGSLASSGARLFPPFHGVSHYRDPGRINLNTIVDSSPTIWDGVRAGRTGFPVWFESSNISRSLASSRQGYSGNPSNFPSPFMNPFRSYGGAELRLPDFAARDEIDVTIFRKQGTENYPNNNNNPNPLFIDDIAVNSGASTPYADAQRNAYFYYQDMQRYSNLITTRSNVYAIWMTVGYFEVTPWGGYTTPNSGALTVDDVHPDGYQLGQELGIETGEIKRHRAFYVFDRSLPVGFKRGENLNIDKGMLLKRYIE